MSILEKKSGAVKIAGLAMMLAITACSSDQRVKRQANGDRSYLQSTEPRDIVAPTGITLPLQNAEYEIPAARKEGAAGDQLDIRPPIQPLALINGSRTQFNQQSGTLILENGHSASLWANVVQVVQSYHFPIAQRQDGSQQLTTDWVEWQRADEEHPYRGRYQITLQQQGAQQLLTVRLLQLQQQGNRVADPAQMQRYRTRMLNDISTGLEKRYTAQDAAAAGQNVSQIPVQSGVDETGLPNLILRAPYLTVIHRLPAELKQIGMNIIDENRSRGTLKVSYSEPDSNVWNQLRVQDPRLVKGDYHLQVGDLGNRSSVQFIDAKGHPLTQSQNDALVAVLQAAFSK